MTAKGVAEALLLPPVSLLLFAFAGLAIERHYRRAGRAVVWAALLFLLVLAIPEVSGWLLVSLEQGLPLAPPPDAPPQAIVILGGDALRTRAFVLQPGPLSLGREVAGALLFRRTRLPILVSGGVLREGEPPIAAVMADSLEHDLQTPVQWVEQTSLDTWQNARNSAAILRAQGIHSVYVVTHPWHMRRAVIAFAATGIKVTAAPTHFDQPPRFRAADLLPEIGGWRTSYYAIHEWVGCAWYELR